MNEWEKIVLPLKGKQEIQKRSPGTFHVEARRQDEATVISGEYCFEGDRAFFSELLKTSLETLAERIQQEQGLIGHIKTSLEIQDTEVFSVTSWIKRTAEKAVSAGWKESWRPLSFL